jgi:hypothetical protein
MRTKRQVGKGVRGYFGLQRGSTIFCYDNTFKSLDDALTAHVQELIQRKDPDAIALRASFTYFLVDRESDSSSDVADKMQKLIGKITHGRKFRSTFNDCEQQQEILKNTTEIESKLQTVIENVFLSTQKIKELSETYHAKNKIKIKTYGQKAFNLKNEFPNSDKKTDDIWLKPTENDPAISIYQNLLAPPTLTEEEYGGSRKKRRTLRRLRS